MSRTWEGSMTGFGETHRKMALHFKKGRHADPLKQQISTKIRKVYKLGLSGKAVEGWVFVDNTG